MNYRISHITRYDYDDPVSVSHHILRLTPRQTTTQTCLDCSIRITPKPSGRATHDDYFGNHVTTINVLEPHEAFTVESESHISVRAGASANLADSPPWEAVQGTEEMDACQYIFDSPRASAGADLADYARGSFTPGRPLFEATHDLMRRIHSDFRFDTSATEVSTPVETFFELRRGVCQDFAHLQIACLRSLRLPARYVSGYLRTLPPPGKARLIGADASHAWCSVWAPGTGWVDYDPTNNCLPGEDHITVAWGRDYGDVSPVYGVVLGGASHAVDVAVDVMPIE